MIPSAIADSARISSEGAARNAAARGGDGAKQTSDPTNRPLLYEDPTTCDRPRVSGSPKLLDHLRRSRVLEIFQRVQQLSEHMQAIPGRVIAYQIEGGHFLNYTGAYLWMSDNADVCPRWDLGCVVSSSVPELVQYDWVLMRPSYGLTFQGGGYDQDSLSLSEMLESGETLRFFRPMKVLTEHDKGRSTAAQWDLGFTLLGYSPDRRSE